jgi:hypothetical protein
MLVKPVYLISEQFIWYLLDLFSEVINVLFRYCKQVFKYGLPRTELS